MLLTDGDAVDEADGLAAAQALVQDPPFAGGGFKALLVSWDRGDGSEGGEGRESFAQLCSHFHMCCVLRRLSCPPPHNSCTSTADADAPAAYTAWQQAAPARRWGM